MSEICQICNNLNNGRKWTVRIHDIKGYVDFGGHSECVDTLFNKTKELKNVKKKSIQQILDELGLKNPEHN